MTGNWLNKLQNTYTVEYLRARKGAHHNQNSMKLSHFKKYFKKRPALVNSSWQNYRLIFLFLFCWCVFCTVILHHFNVMKKIFSINLLIDAHSVCLWMVYLYDGILLRPIHECPFSQPREPAEYPCSYIQVPFSYSPESVLTPGHCFLLLSGSSSYTNHQPRESGGLSAPPFPHLQTCLLSKPQSPALLWREMLFWSWWHYDFQSTVSLHRPWRCDPLPWQRDGRSHLQHLPIPALPRGQSPPGVQSKGPCRKEAAQPDPFSPAWDMPPVFKSKTQGCLSPRICAKHQGQEPAGRGGGLWVMGSSPSHWVQVLCGFQLRRRTWLFACSHDGPSSSKSCTQIFPLSEVNTHNDSLRMLRPVLWNLGLLPLNSPLPI